MKRFITTNYGYLFVVILSCLVTISTLIFQSIRLDEAQSLWVATKSVPEIFHLDAQDVLVPFYEVLLHFWIQLFGTTIAAARILSFLFFVVTLPFLYQLGKEAGNRKIAIVTITLFSLSPFIMWYSSEAHMYTLFALVTTVNHLFFLRFVRSHGRTGKFGYFVTTILGLYTHYFFILLLITQFAFLLLSLLTNNDFEMGVQNELKTQTNRSFHLLCTWIAILIFVGVCFLPWVIYFIESGAAANTQPLIPPPTSSSLFQAFSNFLLGFQSSTLQSFFISLWPVLALSLFLVFTRNTKQEVEYSTYFALATFLPIILVFLGSRIRPIFLTRYLILVTPTLFFLIAWLLAGYQNRIARLGLALLFCCMFALLVYQNIASTTPVKENYEAVANYLAEHATGSDIIAVSAPFTIYPIEYAYSGNTKIVTIPYWNRLQQGAIPKYSHANFIQQMKSYQTQYIHLFVVLSYDQGYEDDIKKYLDTHYKRITLKDFSPGLEVREYQLRYGIITGLRYL